MADEAKAFCPSCGHAFVDEEKRDRPSAFESMDGTMQFGKTMYNQMLSDMGLNISARPDKASVKEPAIQLVPAVPATQSIKPISPAAAPPKVSQPQAASGKRSNKWLIVGVIAVFLLFLLLVAAIIIGWVVWSRFG
jgi:hypothetical protein